jgi:hypothetical protein
MAHANNSPSGAEGWFNCVRWASDSKSSAAADAGTARHEWTADILLGREVAEGQESKDAPGHFYDDSARADVAVAVRNVQDRIEQFKLRGAISVEMLIEQKLPIAHITGEEGAKGTSDVVLLITWPDFTMQVDVIDHKFGYREVSAWQNKQGFMYVAAAVNEFSVVGDFTKASFAVNQPAARPTIHDYEFDIAELDAFVAAAAVAAAKRSEPESHHPPTPGAHCEKTYCANRATCPALRTLVLDSFEVVPEEATPDELADAMSKVDLIEGWCKQIRAKTFSDLQAGIAVPGYKLVQGKRGNRQWSSTEEAESVLKAMRVPHDRMYDYSVVSPTTADKLAKEGVIGPRQWPKLQALITQAEGKPSVAPVSDKRPALVTSADDDFSDVSDLS